MINIIAQIAEIQSLDLIELRARWATLFGSPAPQYSRSHLVRRLAHRVQELQFGGVSEATRGALSAIAAKDCPGGQVRPLVRRDANSGAPAVGTRYIRTWRGERHEVAVVEGGYEYRGKIYRSLSAVAKAITGQHWNGKLYFGLTNRKKRD